jgi:tetratricopeptide (TPR) repeat protein
MTKKIFVVLFFICALAALTSLERLFAENIVFKSGKTIEAKIIERSDKYIKIDLEGVDVTYFIDELESIDGKPVPKPESSASLNTAADYYKQADKYLRASDYNQAIIYYQKATGEEPSNAKAYAYMGLAYYYLHQGDQAEENFLKAKDLAKDKDYGAELNFVDVYLGYLVQEKAASQPQAERPGIWLILGALLIMIVILLALLFATVLFSLWIVRLAHLKIRFAVVFLMGIILGLAVSNFAFASEFPIRGPLWGVLLIIMWVCLLGAQGWVRFVLIFFAAANILKILIGRIYLISWLQMAPPPLANQDFSYLKLLYEGMGIIDIICYFIVISICLNEENFRE